MEIPNDNAPLEYPSYLDFELEIAAGSGRAYPVAVLNSPAGEAHETMCFPFDVLTLDSHLKDLQIALLRSSSGRRKMVDPEDRSVQTFGTALLDALLVGEVRSRYDVSRREAKAQGKGLRIKLRIHAPELAVLPWEYLYDPRQGEYICLSRRTPVVRYLELPQPVSPLAITPPLRILGVVANPSELPPLNVNREQQRMEEAIKDLAARGLVELVWSPGHGWRDLQRAMRGGPWHILHFIGHGGFNRTTDEGFVAFTDPDGGTEVVSASMLGRLLADHDPLRLAVLNSCEGARGSERDIFSSTASILIQLGLPAVIAMQQEITDRAAVEMSRALFEALADGYPVDAALAEARKSMSLAAEGTLEWGTPVLYMRSLDGALFHIQPGERLSKAIEPRGDSRTVLSQVSIPYWLLLLVVAMGIFVYLIGIRTGILTMPNSQVSPKTTIVPPTQDRVAATLSPTTERSALIPSRTHASVSLGGGTGKIAFASQRDGDDEIYLMDVDGGNVEQLTYNTARDIQPSWSPDGRQIVFASTRNNENWDIYTMNADGSGVAQITNAPAWDADPSWSPDGHYIAFESNRDGNHEIYSMDIYGHNLRNLTANPGWEWGPSWSPDGQQIVFTTGRDGNNEIYLMNQDGSNQTRLTTDSASDVLPAWSSDGQRIAFISDRTGIFGLYVMNPDGGNQQRLTDATLYGYPDWSPNSVFIAFTDDELHGKGEIYRIRADGTELTKLTDSLETNNVPSWQPVDSR